MSETQSSRLGSAYVLAFVFFALAVLLWLRGLGRLLLPVMLLGVVGYGVWWFVKRVREPLDDE